MSEHEETAYVERPPVRLYEQPPDPPLRKFHVLVQPGQIRVVEAHAADTKHGSLHLTSQIGAMWFTVEIFPIGMWVGVQQELPTRETIEQYAEAVNTFAMAHAALRARIEQTERMADARVTKGPAAVGSGREKLSIH